MDEQIAITQLTLKKPGERSRTVNVRVRKPHKRESGEFACEVDLEGLYETPIEVYGEDSYQALDLALEFVRITLAGWEKTGWRLDPYWRKRLSGEFPYPGPKPRKHKKGSTQIPNLEG